MKAKARAMLLREAHTYTTGAKPLAIPRLVPAHPTTKNATIKANSMLGLTHLGRVRATRATASAKNEPASVQTSRAYGATLSRTSNTWRLRMGASVNSRHKASPHITAFLRWVSCVCGSEIFRFVAMRDSIHTLN